MYTIPESDGHYNFSMEDIVQKIKASDELLQKLKEAAEKCSVTHYQSEHFEIICPCTDRSIYLIRNRRTGTIFSPTSNLVYNKDLITELEAEYNINL